MDNLSANEIARQYRVLKQTLSMHSDLRDEFMLKSRVAEIVILVCSAILCSVTFASDDFYRSLGMVPEQGRVVTGIASVAAFAFSLALIVLGWNREAAQHAEAAKRWSDVLERFRATRLEDMSWPSQVWAELSGLYWQADKFSVDIPGRRFNALKAQYLRKVLISRLKSKYPGAPRFILWLLIRIRHTSGALRDSDINT
jgi:hypothetical protein